MTDTIIQGSGNSRSIKSVPNLATLAPTYDKLLELLTKEGLPIDLGPLNPAGLKIRGTDLNKGTLLSDNTSNLYELDETATPDDAFKAIKPLIDSANTNADGRTRIFLGSYIGTGTNSRTFTSPVIGFLMICFTPGSYGAIEIFATNKITGHCGSGLYQNGQYSRGSRITRNGNTYTVEYSSSTTIGLNNAGSTYQYLIIG